MSDSDDDITLPQDTLNILNEFLKEKQEREEEETNIINSKDGKSIEFEENWVNI